MATHPQTLLKAAALIERFEGIELEAYLDPIGIPTICAGLTRYPNGSPVRIGDECSDVVCRGYLEVMLEKQFVPTLERIPGWERLGPNRQAVLLSFAWNLGADFYGAKGFETITQVLREGAIRPETYQQMSNALGLYVKAGNKVLKGLVHRREEEARIWNSEDDGIMIYVCKQDTFLKKAPIDSRYLSSLGRKEIKAGEEVSIVSLDEIPQDAHAWVKLIGDGQQWVIYGPHWAEKDTLKEAEKTIKPNWSDFGSRVGKHITVGEVLQYDSRRRPKEGSTEEKEILRICEEFDKIREAWGGPLGVTSGYRPEPINRQVGGVPNSYHVRGQALDIYPVNDSLEKFHRWLLKRWSGGYGDGRNKGFIHIDTRNHGRFDARAGVKPAVTWTY